MMIAFFIDADNLCAPKWIDEALTVLEGTYGPVSIKRAYGSAEKLKGLADICRARSIRPFVNLPLSKNTTDVALVVDVMAISYQTPCPAVVAIGSGDVDFLPLVLWLRERGVRVICIAEQGKMASEAMTSYEKVVFVGQAENAGPTKAAQELSEPSTTIVTPPVPSQKVATKAVNAAPNTSKSGSSSKPVTKKAATKSAKKPALANSGAAAVENILEAIPQLRDGGWTPLNALAKQLRDKDVLAKSASSPKLFGKYPQDFVLDPKAKPTRVRYIG